jgi:hypothetical protein
MEVDEPAEGREGRTRGEEWRAHGEVGTHCVGHGQMSG